MKSTLLKLIIIFGALSFKPGNATSQKTLPTGLYQLKEHGTYKLLLDGKTYYTDAVPIATINNIKTISVTPDRIRKKFYDLNIELDNQGTIRLKEATPFVYKKLNIIGLVIKGRLILAPKGTNPITSGKLSISDTSKTELEVIAKKLKAEQH